MIKMIKYDILSSGILVCVASLLLSSCATSGGKSDPSLAIVDHTGRYESKIPSLLKKAEQGMGKKYKGEKIVIFKPDENSPKRTSDITSEDDPTIAYAYYRKSLKTGYIQPVVQRPARWAMLHEIGHLVDLSNGGGGHPQKYEHLFKYWNN